VVTYSDADAVIAMGQIASYALPGGSGGGAASTAATGKSAPRRRGARRDCDRVSKAEDVPEYKGSLPFDELLAFVEGSVPSPAAGVRMPADAKLRRTKRKDPLPGDADLKLRNGDAKLVDVDVPVPSLGCLPDSEPLNGLLNGSSGHPEKLVSGLPVNFDGYVEDGFAKNEWLSSGLASHLMATEDHVDGTCERKEKEFVLVQKKRRQKIAATVNGDVKNVEHLNGFCLSKNGTRNAVHNGIEEEYEYMNGFSVADVSEANGSTVSRNSSEDSLAQSLSSDIDDLSHFVGEDGNSGGELYVDAPLCWNDAGDEDEDDDDDKDVSLSSFCSTMSSTESRQRLNSPSSHEAASPDIDRTDVFTQDEQNLQSEQPPVDSVIASAEQVSLTDNCMIPAVQRLKADCSPVSVLSSDHCRQRCTRPCCTVPHKHMPQQTAVVFCDSTPDQIVEDVSGVMFSFGCMVLDHLLDDGLCIEAKSAAVLADNESKPNGAKRMCSESPELPVTAGPCDGFVSFMYSDSIPQRMSSSSQRVEDPLQSCARTCNGDVHSNADCTDHFQVHDVQSYMYTSKYQCLVLCRLIVKFY